MVLTPKQDRHAVMDAPCELIGGGHDQRGARNRLARLQSLSIDPITDDRICGLIAKVRSSLFREVNDGATYRKVVIP